MDLLGWIVSLLLISISGGVVLLVMYFGTREKHPDENKSDQSHE